MSNKLKIFIVALALLLALFSVFVLFLDRSQDFVQTQNSEEFAFQIEKDGEKSAESGAKADSLDLCDNSVVADRMKRYKEQGLSGYFENMNLPAIDFENLVSVPFFDSVRKDSAVKLYEIDFLRIRERGKKKETYREGDDVLYPDYNFFYKGQMFGDFYCCICYHYEDCAPNLRLYVLNDKLEIVSDKTLAVGNGCFTESEEPVFLDNYEMWESDINDYVKFLTDTTFVISRCSQYYAKDMLTDKESSLEECENTEFLISSKGEIFETGKDTVRNWSENLVRK